MVLMFQGSFLISVCYCGYVGECSCLGIYTKISIFGGISFVVSGVEYLFI